MKFASLSITLVLVVMLIGGTSVATAQVNGTFKLLGATVTRGTTVDIPFIIHSDQPIIAYSFSIDFDEEILQATGATTVFQRPDGQPYDLQKVHFNNDNQKPGNAGVDEGYLVGGAAFSYQWDVALPANTDNEVLVFHFMVREKASAALTEIRFIDGAESRFFTNALVPSVDPAAIEPKEQPASVLVGAALKIVSAPSFQRGDSNGDGKLDLSDAVRTLDFLFSGDKQLTCEDAADTNDDGGVDISDAVATLSYLFLGSLRSEALGVCGIDQTEDNLGCESYPSCG